MASDLLKLWVALSVICVVHVQARNEPSITSCNFFDVVKNTPLEMLAQALQGEIVNSVYEIGNFTLKLAGQTDRLPVLVSSIKNVGSEAFTVMKNLIDPIERITSDRTVPPKELLELFEKPYQKMLKFFSEFFEPFINEIQDHMGCTMALEVKSISRKIIHQAKQIASIIDRLKKAVEDPCRRKKDMLQLVTVLSNRVQKIIAIVTEAKGLFANAASGIAQAAELLMVVDGTRNDTIAKMKSNKDDLRKSATIVRDSALLVYTSGLEAIRTNISASIATLSVFESSRKLSKLTKGIATSYDQLAKVLHDHNRTDVADIKQYYRRMVKNMEAAGSKVSYKLLDAAFRTALKLVDIVLERSPDSDSCLTTYQLDVVTPFAEIPDMILSCAVSEPQRWEAVVESFSANVGLLSSTYDQLAVNIAGCSNFTNFTVDSSHYLQAKACLKTNLEDLNNLVQIFAPQFEAIDTVIKLDVDVSKFRVENCLANKLHSNAAKMKVTRTLIDRCAGRIDDCPRKNRDDDANDWYARDNAKSGFVDESDEADSLEQVDKTFFRFDSTDDDDGGEEVSYEINSEEETVFDEN